MKPPRSAVGARGITLPEVLVVLAVLTVLTALLLPRMFRPRSRVPAARIACVNNLKQVGLAFRLWAADHEDRFPMSVAVTNGGAMDHRLLAQPWVHFQGLSNELSTPRILACPADRQRQQATNFTGGFSNTNVSHFIGLNANEAQPQMWLAGDRNLTTNGVEVSPGLLLLTTNHLAGWTEGIHRRNGNIALADGSVQQLSEPRLRQAQDPSVTNRLAIP